MKKPHIVGFYMGEAIVYETDDMDKLEYFKKFLNEMFLKSKGISG